MLGAHKSWEGNMIIAKLLKYAAVSKLAFGLSGAGAMFETLKFVKFKSWKIYYKIPELHVFG